MKNAIGYGDGRGYWMARMKWSLLAACAFVFTFIGCERHPASTLEAIEAEKGHHAEGAHGEKPHAEAGHGEAPQPH